MNHSGMTDEDVKAISKECGAKLSELTGLDSRIIETLIFMELKGSNFEKSEKKRQ